MSRRDLLNKLLNTCMEASVIANELNEFDWDSDKELVILSRQHFIKSGG